jgi:GNAT superfamily N-acetyltransferase
LTELYLLPATRGRGLERRALPLIEQLAREHGARALHLMVRPENLAALQLYRGAGYSSPPRTFLQRSGERQALTSHGDPGLFATGALTAR